MILRAIYLKAGDLGLPTEFTYRVLKRSRFICNYIEREVLDKIRFRTENFDRIVISLCSTPGHGVFINSSNVACADIAFDRQGYESLSGNDLSFYYIGKLKEGLEKCDEIIEIPKVEIFHGLEDFAFGGMENRWVHKQRLFRQVSLRVSLECKLTQEAFNLRLIVFKDNKLVFDSVILKTDPDEIAFEYRFKDIKLDADNLVITSKTSEPLWQQHISKLSG